MKKLAFFISLIVFCSCNKQQNKIPGDRKVKDAIQPFKVTIIQADYSLGGSNHYLITEKDLTIVNRSGLVGVKDTTIYYKLLPATENIKKISKINLDTLKEEYINSGVKDGTQIHVTVKKLDKEKSISISNYYQQNIGELIELVNTQVPESLKITYKKELLRFHRTH